jgi:HSP20 family molecular chaperone IbpA
MNPELIEIMRDQVSNIYRAATGTAMPDSEPSASEPEALLEEVTRSFAELEALARTIPSLAERVPPFSFTPPLDAVVDGDDLVIELAVPGIEDKDVTVECVDGMLVVSGVRRGHRGSDTRTYSHGEIPCGTFYRTYRVPFPTHGEPAVDLDRGLVRIRLKSSPAKQQTEELVSSSRKE